MTAVDMPTAPAPSRPVDVPSGFNVTVEEVSIGSPGLAGLVVTPSVTAVQAGILWLHWLGDERSDRSQFLAEAIELAGRGCISILPTGQFPWARDPDGTTRDRLAVDQELRRAGEAFSKLETISGKARSRLAVVGHDYGAMYALASAGFEAQAVVAIAPDSDWSHWFCRYWLDGTEPSKSYAAAFADVQPLQGASDCQDRLLLQWAENDEYVPADTPARYEYAAPRAVTVSYEGRDHRVGGQAAVRDRREFLIDRLRLIDAAR